MCAIICDKYESYDEFRKFARRETCEEQPAQSDQRLIRLIERMIIKIASCKSSVF